MADTKTAKKNKWKNLCLSLKYRPKIMKLILKMRNVLRRKNAELKSLKHLLDQGKSIKIVTSSSEGETEKKNYSAVKEEAKKFKDTSTQTSDFNITKKKSDGNIAQTDEKTRNEVDLNTKTVVWKSGENDKSIAEQVKEAALNALTDFEKKAGWNVNDVGDNEQSIADQVKEVAQSALLQTGMVYIESAGMYYDYKTGYYYNSELGLYYHTNTNCYYYYSDEKQQFVFHSYPDTSGVNANLVAHQKKKARKQLKRERKTEDDVDNLTKTLSQDNEDTKKPKRRKIKKSKKNGLSEDGSKVENGQEKIEVAQTKNLSETTEVVEMKDIFDKKDVDKNTDDTIKTKDDKAKEANEQSVNSENKNKVNEESKNEETNEALLELEDGECSDSSSEDEKEEDEDSSSNASTATVSDEDAIAKHHPPCMRVIVLETVLPKLKVGNLFLITKDGGTIGREGEQHAILLKDNNVSRNHLDVRYDMERKTYVVMDLGSKNGTILNGYRMSESSEISSPMDIPHGSTIQLGETKLLCHIHPGNDTCGHCEPGLIIASADKDKKAAYTRTCSVKKQHELELARLKNIYAPKLLQIEEKPYNDRAQARRETVGSSHHSAKTESTDLETAISTENKGFKLLQKMGWSKGEGLGKDCQGNTEPVPLISNDGKAGLGTSGAVSAPPLVPKPRAKNTIATATMHLATRTKMLKPPAKAFQLMDEEDSE